jgi:hypothetical protein
MDTPPTHRTPIMLDRIKIPALAVVDYIRGRVVPMYRRSNILWCSYYMTFLGRTFLRTPMFTNEDTNKSGLGPMPEYMQKEFYYWKTDRTVKAGPDHINGSILKAIYCYKMHKFLSWRVFVVSLLFCTGLSLAEAGLWSVTDWTGHLGHRLVHAVTGLANSPSSDDINDVIPSDARKAIADAIAAKPVLTDTEKSFANSTYDCANFIAGIVATNAAQIKNGIKDPAVMAEVGQKLAACKAQGYTYNADLVSTLKPFQTYFGTDKGEWVDLIAATTRPGKWPATTDFTKCDETIKAVAASPNNAGPGAVHMAADCLNNGSTLPASTSAYQDN